jgi:hypothetical protein
MPDSKANMARFRDENREVIFVAGRPDVLPLVKEVSSQSWGFCVDFHGSRADLISAGVACEEMFEGMGKSGQRTRSDQFGDQYTIKRRSNSWIIEYRFRNEGHEETVYRGNGKNTRVTSNPRKPGPVREGLSTLPGQPEHSLASYRRSITARCCSVRAHFVAALNVADELPP